MPIGMTVQARGTTGGSTIAVDAAGYAGTTTTKVADGPSAGSRDVYIKIYPIDTCARNKIRPFRKYSGVADKVPWGEGTYELSAQIKNPDAPWQKAVIIGPMQIGPGDEAHLSKEAADNNLRYDVTYFDYQ